MIPSFSGGNRTGFPAMLQVVLVLLGVGAAQANTLTLTQENGLAGSTVLVSLALDNSDQVKGVQLDLQFDGAVASFQDVTAAERGLGMTAAGSLLSAGTCRVVLYFADDGVLAAGSGEIAQLAFTLQGLGGEQTDLTPGGLLLSGPDAESLDVTGSAGGLTVSVPEAVPQLRLSALKNPGQPRSIQLLLKVGNGSQAGPTLTCGGMNLPLVALGEGIYRAVYLVSPGVADISFSAADNNSQGTGTAQVTVTYP